MRLPAVACALAWFLFAPAMSMGQVELVGEGVLSTPDDELGATFDAAGKTVYFTKRSPTTNTPPLSILCVSRLGSSDGKQRGVWGHPEVVPFSGRYFDTSPVLTVDGARLFFASDRPGGQGLDLWQVERRGAGWSEPIRLGPEVNSAASEANPSLARDGTLYFASSRPGGKGGADLYRARPRRGGFAPAENLGALNSAGYDSQPAISPDGTLLVFTSLDRPDMVAGEGAPYSRPDLYVSRASAGVWSAPRHLPAPVDTSASESMPSFSPDGRWLYFSSDRGFATVPLPRQLTAVDWSREIAGVLNGWNNLYRVPVELVKAAVGGAR